MPYSITTKDGIMIADIPDDIPADHPSLRERVATIRGQKAPTNPDTAPSAGKGGMLGGLWMGLRDPIDAGAQILSRGVDAGVQGINSVTGLNLPRPDVASVDRIVNTADAERQQSRQLAGNDGFDGSRMVGNIVNPVNLVGGWSAAAAKTLPQLALRGAQAGAIGAATQPVVGDTTDFWSQKAGQAATGALAGAVATPLLSKGLEAAGTAVKAGANMLQRGAAKAAATPERINVTVTNVLNSAGVSPADITDAMRESIRTQVQQALAAGQKLDPKALLRQAQAEAVGLTDDAALTLGQRTREPMQFAREQNLSGINLQGPQGAGNPLSTRFAEQNKRLGQVFEPANGAGDPLAAGQTMMATLQAANETADANVRAAYGAFRSATGRDLEVPLQGLAQDYAATLRDFGDTIPSAIRNQFEALGLLGGTQRRGMDITEAERLIKLINVHYDPGNKAQRAGLDQLRNGLQRAVTEAADVADNGAGAEAAQLASEARQTAAGVFQARKDAPALAAAQADKAPDRFVQQYLIGAPVRDVQALAPYLQQNPEAWQQARAQIAETLRRAAFGENLSGDKVFAPERYATALRQLGPQRLEVFFTPQEMVRLNLVGKVASDTLSTPAGAQRAVNYSNTGAANANNVLSVLSKISESPLMRNLPGARSLANQVGEIKTEREIGRALSQQAPKPSAELSPEALRALRLLLPPGAVGLGAAVGSTAQP